MILDLLQGRYNINDAVIVSIVMIFALMLHNIAQAWTAQQFGDNSPKNAGFLNFDPQQHIDPTGLVLLLVLGFGWPKQIFVNSRNYNSRNNEALVWYSGPLAYLAVAFLCTIVAVLLSKTTNGMMLANSFILAASVSTLHGVINLFPIHPLDGAFAALAWGNSSMRRMIAQVASYGFIGFIVVFTILNALGVISGLMFFFQGMFFRIANLFLG